MIPGISSIRCCAAALAVGILALGGCAVVPKDFDRTPSWALEDPSTTTAGKFFRSELEENPSQSGFILLPFAEESFRARNGAAAIADKTIDAQYYIWKADASGKLLINRLINAADRGVRVRLLLDDLLTTGRT